MDRATLRADAAHGIMHLDLAVIESEFTRLELRMDSSFTEHGFLWSDGRKLGKDRVRLDLGQSRVVFSRAMESILIFESDSRLDAIHVRKEIKAP